MSFTADLTLRDRATMATRATYLITIFLPFIFLGPLLLFLADLLLKWSQDSKVEINGHRCLILHKRHAHPWTDSCFTSMNWQEMAGPMRIRHRSGYSGAATAGRVQE